MAMEEERRHDVGVLAERVAALDRHVTAEIEGLKELLRSQRVGDQLAVKTALDTSEKLAEKHNDLIRQMEKKDATYATGAEVDRLASWQRMITGGIVVVGAIGITNLVKVWGG